MRAPIRGVDKFLARAFVHESRSRIGPGRGDTTRKKKFADTFGYETCRDALHHRGERIDEQRGEFARHDHITRPGRDLQSIGADHATSSTDLEPRISHRQ